ncbi:MAG: MOSC domain-containing protein [Peptococcaceae bacterium]|jgi:molybdenum cofactor synthesis domain-containing protein|nr:MOSC domain-containing protein [Peptococcaceae bacterium]
MGIIKAICISDKRGIQKRAVEKAVFDPLWGIAGDAHGGDWHRQVSLLSYDKVEAFKARGAEVGPGDFAENMLVEGFDFRSLPVGSRFGSGSVILEMTQIGKECHTHCQIYQKMGECIMPTEGVFAIVVQGGEIHVGDELALMAQDEGLKKLRAAILILSDKGSKGEREDKCGPLMKRMLEEEGYEAVETLIIPDEQKQIEEELIRFSDGRQVDLVLTSGGTGFSMRDVTPEATLAVAPRLVPGIAEAIRAYSMTITKRAMLGRGVAAIRGRTLIVNLPGSPKAVEESLGYILPELEHGLEIMRGEAAECARTD